MMGGMLPEIRTPDAYLKMYGDTARFAPAIRTIAARHGLSDLTPRRFKNGSNFVFGVGPKHVVKLMAPLYKDEFAIERAGLAAAATVLTAPFPEILFEGELEGWPYLVIRRLSGRPLAAAWGEVPVGERVAIAEDLGTQMAALARASLPPGGPLRVNWPVFIESNIQNAAFIHTKGGASAGWTAALPAFLESHRARLTAPVSSVLLHADLTSDNTMLARKRGRWYLAGIIDFADAMVGHPDYEMIAPTWFCRKTPEAFRALYEASGRPTPDADTCEGLLAWHLAHRFGNLKGLVSSAPGVKDGDFAGLARTLYPS